MTSPSSRHGASICLQGAGKTRTHSGGNIADIIMFPKCVLVLPRAQHLCPTQSVCPGHKKCFWSLQKHFLCPRGAQQCCLLLPRTGNILGHNIASTMCPRFAQGLIFWQESHACIEQVARISFCCYVIVQNASQMIYARIWHDLIGVKHMIKAFVMTGHIWAYWIAQDKLCPEAWRRKTPQ